MLLESVDSAHQNCRQPFQKEPAQERGHQGRERDESMGNSNGYSEVCLAAMSFYCFPPPKRFRLSFSPQETYVWLCESQCRSWLWQGAIIKREIYQGVPVPLTVMWAALIARPTQGCRQGLTTQTPPLPTLCSQFSTGFSHPRPWLCLYKSQHFTELTELLPSDWDVLPSLGMSEIIFICA